MTSAREHDLERTQIVPVSPERAFEFFADPRNLEAITPAWLGFRLDEAPLRVERGSRLAYRLRLFGLPVRWLTEITVWRPPRTFTDVQLEGPYRLWEHTHRLAAVEDDTEIHDHVRYRVPLEPLAGLVVPLTVERWLDETFDYRARRVGELVG